MSYTLNNKNYELNDSVSMGSSLGPMLVNIIMKKLENEIIKRLIINDLVKFCCRSIDDTLFATKN